MSHIPHEARARVDAFIASPRRLLIGGSWVEAADGASFSTPNPATGHHLAQIAEAGPEDVDRAVKAARAALESPAWAALSPAARGALIGRLADLVDRHADELALLETHDQGKPYTLARNGDVPRAAQTLRYFAGWPTKLEGRTLAVSPPPGMNLLAYTRQVPVGVVAQIIPWNFPLPMACRMLGPALASGCTVVLKPAEQTPLSALRLAELVLEAGFPQGVVNVLTGFGERAGDALVKHPGIDKIAFIGSTGIGKLIARTAAEDLKRVTLELGGKNAAIAFPDADPDAIAAWAAHAAFFNAGQVCTAGSRLFVHRRVHDAVVEALAREVRALVVGDGIDPASRIGPLTSAEHLARVGGLVAEARSAGSTLAIGGGRPEGLPEELAGGFFHAPTVFADVDPASRLAREEVFGPVLTVTPWEDVDEVVRQANDTAYGLAAGLFTQDLSVAHGVGERLKAGTVWVNAFNILDAAAPFGGLGQSGLGREFGEEGLRDYTETRTFFVNYTPPKGRNL